MKWVVPAEDSGHSLLAFLKSKLGAHSSSRQLKRAVDLGNCRINGRVERFSSKLVGFGDRVEFNGGGTAVPINTSQHEVQSRILYLDEDIIAYNKPAGISADDKSLLTALEKCFKLTLLHRLDRDTTGVLLFGRNPSTVDTMLSLFRQRQISKTYLALVDGTLSRPSGVVENFLGKLYSYQGQAVWGAVPREKGCYARTVWRVQRIGTNASLLQCNPETGRTHQIRVHLSGLGYPILGDHQYCRSFQCPYQAPRTLLHASEIAFEHPIRKQYLAISAPLPDDFQEAITYLL